MMEHILDYVVNFHEVVIILSKRKEIIKEILRILKEKKRKREVITLFFLADCREEDRRVAFGHLKLEKVSKILLVLKF